MAYDKIESSSPSQIPRGLPPLRKEEPKPLSDEEEKISRAVRDVRDSLGDETMHEGEDPFQGIPINEQQKSKKLQESIKELLSDVNFLENAIDNTKTKAALPVPPKESKFEAHIRKNLEARIEAAEAGLGLIEGSEVFTGRTEIQGINIVAAIISESTELLPESAEKLSEVLDKASTASFFAFELIELPILVGQGGVLIYQKMVISEAQSILNALIEKAKEPELTAKLKPHIEDLTKWIGKAEDKMNQDLLKFGVKTLHGFPCFVRCTWRLTADIGTKASSVLGVFALVGAAVNAGYNMYLGAKNKNIHAVFTDKLEEKVNKMRTRESFIKFVKSVVTDAKLDFPAKVKKLTTQGITLDPDKKWDNQEIFDSLVKSIEDLPDNAQVQQYYHEYVLHGNTLSTNNINKTLKEHATKRKEFNVWLDNTLDMVDPTIRRQEFIQKLGFEPLSKKIITTLSEKELAAMTPEERIVISSERKIEREKLFLNSLDNENKAKRIMARQGLKALLMEKGLQEGRFYDFKNKLGIFEFITTVSLATVGVIATVLGLAGLAVGGFLLGTPGAAIGALWLGLLIGGLYFLHKKRPNLFKTLFQIKPIILGLRQVQMKYYEYKKYRNEAKRQENLVKIQKLILSDEVVDEASLKNMNAEIDKNLAELKTKIDALTLKIKELTKEIDEVKIQDFIQESRLGSISKPDFVYKAETPEEFKKEQEAHAGLMTEKIEQKLANAKLGKEKIQAVKTETMSFLDELVDGLMAGGGELDAETKDYLKFIGISSKNLDKETLKANLRSLFAGDDSDFIEVMKASNT